MKKVYTLAQLSQKNCIVRFKTGKLKFFQNGYQTKPVDLNLTLLGESTEDKNFYEEKLVYDDTTGHTTDSLEEILNLHKEHNIEYQQLGSSKQYFIWIPELNKHILVTQIPFKIKASYQFVDSSEKSDFRIEPTQEEIDKADAEFEKLIPTREITDEELTSILSLASEPETTSEPETNL